MDWFSLITTEAISNYIVFGFGIIFGIIGWLIVRWITRERPTRIKLFKVNENSLIKINPEVKEDVSIRFRGQEVVSAFLTKFRLQNSGSGVIDDLKIVVNFEEAEIFDVIIDDTIPQRLNSMKKNVTDSALQLTLPFLNPHKLYKDIVWIRVFSSNPIVVKKVKGGGRGWMVEYFDIVEIQSELASDLAGLTPNNVVGLVRVAFKYFDMFLKVYR